MSESDSSNSDTDDSWADDILSCQLVLEQIIIDTNNMLIQLAHIQRKIDGPSVVFEGKIQPIYKWLTEWEDEMEHDTVHCITWGQFLIEKLAQCSDSA